MTIDSGQLYRCMDNTVEVKSFQFALRIVNLHKYLRKHHNEFILSKQLLRSGTSIGANICEAQQAQSRPDFLSKLCIALKEAVETNYWLRLLHESNYLSDDQFSSIIQDCKELERLLTSIVKTVRE